MFEVASPKPERRLKPAALLTSCLVGAGFGLADPTLVRAQPDLPAGRASIVHVVRSGEWLYSIARKYGADARAIAVLNGLKPPYILHPGQRILIPTGSRLPRHRGPQAPAGAPPSVSPGQPSPVPSTATLSPRSPASPVVQPPVPVTPPSFPTVTTGERPPPPRPTPRVNPSELVGSAGHGRAVTIVMPLKDQGAYLGDVATTVTPDGAVMVSTVDVLDVLSKSLSPQAMKPLRDAFSGKASVPLSVLGDAGFKATYDPVQLQIAVAIPGGARPTQALEVAGLDPAQIGKLAKPEPVSGYLNMRGAVTDVHRGTDTGIQQPQVLLDGAFRIHGLVLEGETQYAPGQGGPAFTRQGTRVVYDDLAHTLRWTAGDLHTETDGFQGNVDITGLSVVRLYTELEPQRNIRPTGERSFTLQRASTVETIINGRSVQKVRLDPGSYDLHNFPFVDGANDVQVVIEDDTGQRESLTFSIFFSRSLLKPGLSEFGLFAGIKNHTVDSDLRYDTHEPTFTGFYRRGLTDQLTAGVNLQADKRSVIAGGQVVWGSPLGTIGADLAYSHHSVLGNGYALNFGIDRLIQGADSFRSQSLSASFESRSRNFAPLGTIVPAIGATTLLNPFAFEAALSYGRSFSESTYASLDARYAKGRDAQKDVSSLRATVGYRLDEATNITVDADYEDSGTTHGPGFRVSLTRRLGRTQNVRASYDSHGDQATLSYQDSHGRGVGSWSVSGDLDYTPAAAGVNASATYQANRADLGVTHTATFDIAGSRISDERTTFRGGASIAFAGGSVAIGRPIFDSFALFVPHHSLNGASVVVDPSPDGPLARSDALGPGVLTDLGSYSVRTVVYDVPKAPAGYDIGQGTVLAVPPYRSGYRFMVGSEYSVTVIGRLLDADGAPISLLAGKAFDLDDPQHPPVILFTSRDGKFGAQGLRAGRWRIEMGGDVPATFVITVPKDTNLFRTGDLHPGAAR